jgi:hypothetical protein
MDLGNSLQTADVVIGTLSLIITVLGTYLAWYAASGMHPLVLLCCDSLMITH